jgi:hypothetical protein
LASLLRPTRRFWIGEQVERFDQPPFNDLHWLTIFPFPLS